MLIRGLVNLEVLSGFPLSRESPNTALLCVYFLHAVHLA